jgi:hypothetical protein
MGADPHGQYFKADRLLETFLVDESRVDRLVEETLREVLA